ncbi:tyrosine-type recombinase/integrase [Bradyrhizobium diazoefficiens]|nr:tyrosine-type recombinase/integrase [Bradyrhizobium diazoefficiens]
MIQIYNRPRVLSRAAASFGAETLGGLIHWYTNGDIDRNRKQALAEAGALEDGYPKWHQKLAKATRDDYLDAFEYLRPEFDYPLADITTPDLYDQRDRCAVRKWPRFADQMIAALSSAFRQAVKRGKMLRNPCLGMDKAHTADPNSNREWFSDELPAALARAPMEVKICLMLARYVGVRGQTIVELNRKQFFDHKHTGKAVRYRARKNNKWVFMPVLPEFQTFIAGLKVKRSDGLIAVRDDGTPWQSEKEMQTRVSRFLRGFERDGVIGAGTTLHGLRVTYAAWWKRNGASDGEVADLLGDESESMGKHYTRHVEREVNVIRAFERVKDKP